MDIVSTWISALLFFAILFALHVLYSKATSKKNRVIMIGYMTAAGSLVSLALSYIYFSNQSFEAEHAQNQSALAYVLNSTFLFIFLCFAMMAFYAGVEHSVRIRIAVELYLNKDNSLNFEDLIKYYKPDQATQHRLHQLELGGYIQKSNETIRLTKKGELFAKIGLIGKKFYSAGLGG